MEEMLMLGLEGLEDQEVLKGPQMLEMLKDHKNYDPHYEAQILQKFMGAVKVNDSQQKPKTSKVITENLEEVAQRIEMSAASVAAASVAPQKDKYHMPELELNTITMVSSLNQRFNLDVVSKYIQLSDQFIGMLSNGKLTGSKKIDQKSKSDKGTKGTKNQKPKELIKDSNGPKVFKGNDLDQPRSAVFSCPA